MNEAYLNAGQWTIDCACGATIEIASEGPAVCGTCRTVHPWVSFPDRREEIIACLWWEPDRAKWNWRPGVQLGELAFSIVQRQIDRANAAIRAAGRQS